MTAATIGIEGALNALQTRAGEMSLRVWMEVNRDALLDAWKGRRLNWQALCPWFAEVGLTNAKGETASIECAKRIWHRVGKVLEDRREHERMRAEAAETRREELRARRVQEEADAQARREAHAAANRELAQRQLEEARKRSASVLFPDLDLGPSAAPAAQGPVAPKESVQEQTPSRQPAVRIGEIAKHIVMRRQATRFGKAALEPLPEPYVGPRPEGMPEDLPLEALMPLSASGRTPEGKYDFERMPGLPRRSFFEMDREWALCCLPMIEAIPPRERNGPLRAMFCFLEMKVGR